MESDHIRADNELPNQMANLDIVSETLSSPEEVAATKAASPTAERVLRKRKSLCLEDAKPTNRRVAMQPRKRVASEMCSPKEIEALYLNKKVKTTSQTLETIFEEPKTDKNESVTLIGGRKVKRLLSFQLGNHFTKEKIKKRRAKIKKLLGNKTFLNRKKIPMSVFLKTIQCLELDDNVENSDKYKEQP